MDERWMERIAEQINILGTFCGKRDVRELTCEELKSRYGITQADVMVLFGGSIMSGGDVLAQAIKDQAARKYVIVGGAGHTTESLRRRVHEAYPMIETAGLTEAEIFNRYIKHKYGVEADYLECESTNCGNNITYLLDLLKREGVSYAHMILSQDATMQRRMEAGLRKYTADEAVQIINYAAYSVNVTVRGSELVYDAEIEGMWDIDRYVNLLMGEIPRLTDDGNGYGPKGRDFIAHVEVPQEVKNAFEVLKQEYGADVREANPLYASV